MEDWIAIRWKARECHREAIEATKGDRRAASLLAAALQNDDLKLRHFDPGTTFEHGVYGVLEREYGIVNVARGQTPEDESVVIAHEIGHNRLHDDPIVEVTVRTALLAGDRVDSGAGKVEGYSSRERKEIQADVFAEEFLCPVDWLRQELLVGRRKPGDIAAELSLPRALVINQSIRATLLPPLRALPTSSPPPVHTLDASQQVAADWSGKPLLVDAGPGTGKTRTLVQRICRLLDEGAAPSSILALTFSNKAAEEMRERIAAIHPAASIKMWIGTFHAFGLELITKWPSHVNRTSKVHILDQAQSLALLEERLDELPLAHFQNLYEPAYELINVLSAISRCKDDLISASEYMAEASSALACAETDDDRVLAEKAMEVAKVYEVYQKTLADADAVDFGDLLVMAIRLATEHPEVKRHLAGYTHIVVDEYQDVNLASARMLRAICGEKIDLWVVADQRQSIYRFRGAEPSNVGRFPAEFGGERHSLDTNYRSFSSVVAVFQSFSVAMNGGAMAGNWSSKRGSGGEAVLTVMPSLAAEAEAIRDRIESYRDRGVSYGEQAILGRTHLTLGRITRHLEQLGVPLLYFGDLFERDEIRDLLSLVSLDAEPGGIGLVRLAKLPQYGASGNDALTIIRWAKERHLSVFDSLKQIDRMNGVSEIGRLGLGKLGIELEGLQYSSPWVLLTTWLLERGDYLWDLCRKEDPKSQQMRLAIYHLLKVCAEHPSVGNASRRNFADRIRRIEALNQDSSYRAVASEATDVDAVRVMTIHASKGLEFRAVHLPAVATRYMPVSRKGVRCPPPSGLGRLAMLPEHHDAEEECLFFVGLSRAKEFLSLSRAERYTSQAASASKYIPRVAKAVKTGTYAGTGKVALPTRVLSPPAPRDCYDERDLDLYKRCPARYRYEAIDGLRGFRDEAAYIRFHRCVYGTVRWLEEQSAGGRRVETGHAIARLREHWQESGPHDHPFERYYWRSAEEMVKIMVTMVGAETGTYERGEWRVPIGARAVAITPDRVVIRPGNNVHVQRIRTGRKTKSELDKPVYALLSQGARLKYPTATTHVEILYLGTGERVEVAPTGAEKGIKKYADAIAAIERGEFPPEPDPRACPNCQCYFICRE